MNSAPRKTGTPTKRKPKHPTWEHPAGSGIKIAEMPNKTKGKVYGVSYQVRVPGELLGIPNGRELLQRRTKADAERLAEDRYLALRKHGTEFARIPADAQRLAAMAWGILTEHNETAPKPLNFVEVVRAGIRTLSPAGGKKTLAEVFAELRSMKGVRREAGKLGSATAHDFTVRSERIARDLGERFVGEIPHTDIAAWLEKMAKEGAQFGGPLSARSVRNYRNTLAEAFNHAVARRYCSENPFDRFTREDLKTHGGENSEPGTHDINILSVYEARRLLAAAAEEPIETGMLASTVLRLFCGFRTTEVCRLDWSEVRLNDAKPFVHLPASKAKKRRVRNVDIPANAVAWLKLCTPAASGMIVPGTGDSRADAKNYCKRFRKIVKAAGIGRTTDEGWESEWENNDTRHSFGSYDYDLHGDPVRTSRLMGQRNEDVLFANYRQLVEPGSGKAYFEIFPGESAGNITAFPPAVAAG